MRTEAWWCCTCGAKINKVGKKDPGNVRWNAHLKLCPITEQKKNANSWDEYIPQGMHIVQCPQGKP